MSDVAVKLENLGKMYKLYRRPIDRIWDAFGVNRLLFWRKNYYQQFWALRNLHLEIRKGERLGIIGRNGAGKSTLLKIISGNISASEGVIQVNGRIQALMELGTGFHPEFTGRQNIRASLAYQGYSTHQIQEMEEEISDFAELDDFINQPIKTYSAGMYARLAFSCATAIRPEILIIDEILGAGDAYFAGKCIERMEKLTRESGATILFVSHDLSSVQRLCERSIWIERGQLILDGESLNVIKEYSYKIRYEEEIRLKARDMKISKKQAITLDSQKDLSDTLLFHLTTANGLPPNPPAKIYNLKLLHSGNEIGVINIGKPMDNSSNYLHYVLDVPGYMDWGQPDSDEKGTFRNYGDFQGRYRHAPFEFAVPKSLSRNISEFQLEMTYASEFPFLLEWYDGKSYQHIDTLSPQPYGTKILSIVKNTHDSEIVLDDEPIEDHLSITHKPIDEYGKGGARILSVQLRNKNGEETRVFEVGDPLLVEIRFATDMPIQNPIFVFCVYLSDGQCATQWDMSTTESGTETVFGDGIVRFTAEKLILGRGYYIASAAIFKYRSKDGSEPESYHVLDRCIHFQIRQKIEQIMDMGLCIQDVRAELING